MITPPLQVKNCKFISNTGALGGGIYCDNSDIEIMNCSFEGNEGVYGGGGIWSDSSNPVITNCSSSLITSLVNLVVAGYN